MEEMKVIRLGSDIEYIRAHADDKGSVSAVLGFSKEEMREIALEVIAKYSEVTASDTQVQVALTFAEKIMLIESPTAEQVGRLLVLLHLIDKSLVDILKFIISMQGQRSD